MKNLKTHQRFAGQENLKIEGDMTGSGDFRPYLLPWGSLLKWREINRNMVYLIERHQAALEGAVEAARGIQVQLETIFPLLDDLCLITCPHCPDPCCLGAKVWIDFRDLLFLHLSGQRIPQVQLLPDLKHTCRYWSFRGCTLERIVRPWVCTWYLCPPQTANLRRQSPAVQETFSRTVKAIKAGRNEIKAEFIRATAP